MLEQLEVMNSLLADLSLVTTHGGGGVRAEVPEGDVPGIFSFFSTMCSVPAVHNIQQVPLPSWFQFVSSHREPL